MLIRPARDVSNFNASEASSFLPPGFTNFATKLSDGASGGIITAWKDADICHVRDVELRYSLTSFFEFAADGLAFVVTNVYAPCMPPERGSFLDEQIGRAHV